MSSNAIVILNLAFKLIDAGINYAEIKSQINERVKSGATDEEIIQFLKDETSKVIADAQAKIHDLESGL